MRPRLHQWRSVSMLIVFLCSTIVAGCAAETINSVMPDVINTASASPSQPAPNQSLPPGATRHAGERCAQGIQPPENEGCPQPDDTHCVGTNPQIGQCMLARWGWYDAQWQCFYYRITNIENRDWDVRAGRLNGPYGIPQANPGTKMSGANFVEVVGGGYQGDYRIDPLIQLAWDRVYVRSTYGSPCNIPKSGGY